MPTQKPYPADFRRRFVSSWMKLAESDESDISFRYHCSQFGIPPETGYTWLDKFEARGLEGLETASSAPKNCPHRVSTLVEELIVALRREHATWGPKKIEHVLMKKHPTITLPATSTIGEVLKRNGLVVPRKHRRKAPPYSKPFIGCDAPNNTWCGDFKGQFAMRDGVLCYPFTLTDAFSRFLLRCDGYASTSGEGVRRSLELAFREFGMPIAFRSDNGSPFASRAPGGLSHLSVWLIKLGIVPERITPGRPSENGRHERMHRTLKAEVTKPPAANFKAQQQSFDQFRRIYNEERPHEALGMETPASCYKPSPRPYPKRLPEMTYPDHYVLRKVNGDGGIKWRGISIFITEALRSETVGLVESADGLWEVYFGSILLGTISDARLDLGLIRLPPKR